MIKIVPLIVLALAAYRITRFFIFDTMFSGTRNNFHSFLVNNSQKQGKLHVFWDKLYDLTSCTFCLGWWISLALYTVYTLQYPWDFGRLGWINVFAIAAIQSFVHVLEPDDA